MENKNKSNSVFIEYWRMAICKAAESTGRLVDVKSRAKEAVLFIAVLLVLALGVSTKWIPDDVIQALKGDATSSLRLALFVILILTFLMGVIFSLQLFVIVPVNIYSNKKSEAYRLTWADISINEFSFPKESGLGIGLKIISHKLKEDVITGMRAEISNVKRASDQIGFASSRLGWAIGKDAIFSLLWDGTTVYSDDPILLLIAKSNGREGWIEALDNNRQIVPIKLDNNIHYQIVIEMKGELYALGYELLRCAVIFDLAYNDIEDKFKYKILEIDKFTAGKEILTERRSK